MKNKLIDQILFFLAICLLVALAFLIAGCFAPRNAYYECTFDRIQGTFLKSKNANVEANLIKVWRQSGDRRRYFMFPIEKLESCREIES